MSQKLGSGFVSLLRSTRLKSIDAFRGLAIALMLIADNPGNPSRVYPELRHAAWNGWTLADLAFPFFIVIMGMAIPFAIDRRLEKGEKRISIFGHILARSIVLFFMGLFLNGFPLYDLNVIRIPGVLQRLAIVYLFSGLIYLFLKALLKGNQLRRQVVVLCLASGIVLIYAWILGFATVPEQGNLLEVIDLRFLQGHLYTPEWDPEGILGTLPSIASGLFGLAAGQVLSYPYKIKNQALLTVSLCGAFLLFLGLFLNQWIPINKNVWSSTYVLLTSGLAYLLVVLLYILIDNWKISTIFKPFILLGGSPIIVYVVSELIRKTLWVIPITSQVQGKIMPMDVWLTTSFFTPWAGERLDSLYFSIFYVLLWAYIMRVARHENRPLVEGGQNES